MGQASSALESPDRDYFSEPENYTPQGSLSFCLFVRSAASGIVRARSAGDLRGLAMNHKRPIDAAGRDDAGARFRGRWSGMTRLAVMVGVVALAGACAAQEAAPPVQPQAPASSGPASELSVGAGRDVGDAVDPLAPSTIAAPVRPGKAAKSRITPATRGSFAVAPVRYPDGVVVWVDVTKSGKEDGKGPGAIPGRSYVGFKIRIDNQSDRAVDLNQVVVTTTYGSPARIAAPVYEDPAALDFTGSVLPGDKAFATYFFAVPVQDRSEVSAAVDLDANHATAVVRGRVG